MFIAGQSGSGKTVFAVSVLRRAPRCVYIDPKRENKPGFPVVAATRFLATPEGEPRATLLAALFAQHGPRITIQFGAAGHGNYKGTDAFHRAQAEAVAEAAFLHRNTLYAIDDAMGVLESSPPFWIGRILTEGRALGVGFLGIPQRPHRVPLTMISEAQHVVSFYLALAADVARMCEVNPGFEAAHDLATADPEKGIGGEFLWHVQGAKTVQRCAPLRGSEAAA
jgi:hypothetical protein